MQVRSWAARDTRTRPSPRRPADLQYCSNHCTTARGARVSGPCDGRGHHALIAVYETSFSVGTWTRSRIRPGFQTSYPQSVDAYAQAGHLQAGALSTGHPQFPARRRRKRCSPRPRSSRPPAPPAARPGRPRQRATRPPAAVRPGEPGRRATWTQPAARPGRPGQRNRRGRRSPASESATAFGYRAAPRRGNWVSPYSRLSGAGGFALA